MIPGYGLLLYSLLLPLVTCFITCFMQAPLYIKKDLSPTFHPSTIDMYI